MIEKAKIIKFLKHLSLFFWLMAAYSPIWAMTTASIERDEISSNESIVLSIQTDNMHADLENLDEVRASFEILGHTQSSQVNMVNGEVKTERNWLIELMPKQSGTLTIPSIQVGSDFTQALTLTVKDDDSAENTKEDAKNIIVEMTVDNQTQATVYEQQTIYVTVNLWVASSFPLTRGDISVPELEGNEMTLIKSDERRTTRDKKAYILYTRVYAGSVLQTGEQTIEPIRFDGRYDTSGMNRSLFRQSGQVRSIRAFSEPVTLIVKAIDMDLANAIVGSDLQMSETWSNPPYKVGEPIYRDIEIQAKGVNEKALDNMNMSDIDQAQIYQDDVGAPQLTYDGESYQLTKKYRFVIMPNQAGEIRFPKFSVPWFNTETGKKEEAFLPEKQLAISKNAGMVATLEDRKDNESKKESPSSINDSAQIMDTKTSATNIELTKDASVGQIAFWKWFAICLMVLIAILLLIMFYLVCLLRKPKAGVNKMHQNLSANENQMDLKSAQAKIKQAESMAEVQMLLLQYWNHNFINNQALNLSALVDWIDDAEIKMALNELQGGLYKKEVDQHRLSQTSILWVDLLPRLSPKYSSEALSDQLPDLYA